MSQATFHDIISEADFPTDGKLVVQIAEWQVLLLRIDGVVHALNDRCTHAASPLSEGRVRRGAIMCPLHGARFDVATGRCLGGEYRPLRLFPVRTQGGRIAVAVPDAAPGPEDRAVVSL